MHSSGGGGGEAHGDLSFAGLLNAIDGVAAQEGRLLFLTTNHPQLLSQALVRPGRIDRQVRFDLCTDYQVQQFVAKFYDHEVDTELYVEAARTSERQLSIAELQGILMQQRGSATAALEDLRSRN